MNAQRLFSLLVIMGLPMTGCDIPRPANPDGDPAMQQNRPRPAAPLTLEWLKQVQDTTTSEQQLLGSQEADGSLQTFNNALAAMAFIIEGERARAERVLDFYANRMDPANADPRRQAFFLNGEARGFFQNFHREERDGSAVFLADPGSDRWMGDLAWLSFAYLLHEKTYHDQRYAETTGAIIALLKSWRVPAEHGAYIGHGWRDGDQKLHMGFGHHEGNIDAYALFKLLGEEQLATEIRTWLDAELGEATDLPLDLYTWRALAYGEEAAPLMEIPEQDPRYRKTLLVKGRPVTGFFHTADPNVTNIWVDGVGHAACAYYAVGNEERGDFYTAQLDALLVDRTINGVPTKALPYTANTTGGYDWVDTSKGFTSAVAWYLFAKNHFNPMTLERH